MGTQHSIASRFQVLKENYNPSEVINYMDFIRSQPMESVIENAEFVFIEPTRGTNLLYEMVMSDYLSEEHLTMLVGKMGHYRQKCINEGYENEEHIQAMTRCINEASERIIYRASNEYVIENTILHFKNLLMDYELRHREIVQESLGDMDGTYEVEPLTEDPKYLELKFSSQFVETFFTKDEEISMESLDNLIRTMNQYEAVQEGVITKTARKVALKGEKVTRDTIHNIRKNAADTRRVKVVAKRIPQHVDNLVNATLGRIARADKEERRKRFLEQGFRVRLMKIVRNAIVVGGMAAIHPALAVISIVGGVAADRYMDERVRRELVRDLQTELDVTKEKINDARGGNERQKKYELMRIQKRLENEIARVEYRLDK